MKSTHIFLVDHTEGFAVLDQEGLPTLLRKKGYGIRTKAHLILPDINLPMNKENPVHQEINQNSLYLYYAKSYSTKSAKADNFMLLTIGLSLLWSDTVSFQKQIS